MQAAVIVGFTGIVFALAASPADPLLSSWFTNNSAKYARIYTNAASQSAGNSVTTWSNGSNIQSLPAYSGVQEIYSSSNWVYIRSTGLGIHTMGPWSVGFPNLPVNTHTFYRFPRTPTIPVSKTLTGGGPIGYFVDGVAMFDSRDAFYWNGSSEVNGSGSWNRDAYVNESQTFDPAYAHQPGSGDYHYHANPIALRYLLGDHVDFNSSLKIYSESTNAVMKHSPILGWVCDGSPVYGPYGYSNATNATSGVRRMTSGFQLRNGQGGTDNLTSSGRTNIPAWAVRAYNVSASQAGPNVSTTYPLGRYLEDNAYLGDLGYTQGRTFDLDEYNGRYCVTPEFPNGTYAYFVCISSNGAPTFPYNIGRSFYGTPSGTSVASLGESVTTNFVGGADSVLRVSAPSVNSGTVTLVWSAVEGGTYRVESSDTLTNWSVVASNIAPQQIVGRNTNSSPNAALFYRVTRTALASYDGGSSNNGGGASSVAPGGSAPRGTNVTITITLPTMPPQPPANLIPTSVTLAGTIVGSNLSRPAQGTVLATFTIPANAPTGAQNVVITFTPAPTYTLTGGFTIN